jgi:ankyrin repeat protein
VHDASFALASPQCQALAETAPHVVLPLQKDFYLSAEECDDPDVAPSSPFQLLDAFSSLQVVSEPHPLDCLPLSFFPADNFHNFLSELVEHAIGLELAEVHLDQFELFKTTSGDFDSPDRRNNYDSPVLSQVRPLPFRLSMRHLELYTPAPKTGYDSVHLTVTDFNAFVEANPLFFAVRPIDSIAETVTIDPLGCDMSTVTYRFGDGAQRSLMLPHSAAEAQHFSQQDFTFPRAFFGGENATPLQVAVLLHDIEALRVLLSIGAVDADRSPAATSTALITAAQRGHEDCARLLLPYEAGMTDSEGHTAFFHALREGHSSIARLLFPFEAEVVPRPHWLTALLCSVLPDAPPIDPPLVLVCRGKLTPLKLEMIHSLSPLAAQTDLFSDQIVCANPARGNLAGSPTDHIELAGLRHLYRLARPTIRLAGLADFQVLVRGLRVNLANRTGPPVRDFHDRLRFLLAYSDGSIPAWTSPSDPPPSYPTCRHAALGKYDDAPRSLADAVALLYDAHEPNLVPTLLFLLPKLLLALPGPHAAAECVERLSMLLRGMPQILAREPFHPLSLFVRFCGLSAAGARQLLADPHTASDPRLGAYAFVISAQCGNLPATRLLAPRYNRTCFYNRRTALMLAAEQSQTSTVEALIPFEAGLQDENGWSALMHAVEVGFVDGVRLLLPRERALRAKDGLTAFAISDCVFRQHCGDLFSP